MIEYVNGTVADLTPTNVVIDVGGVGYGLLISLNTYSAVQGKSTARLFVYELIREDAYQLYGFATKLEREMFVNLISVSGVGGQTARMVLSSFTPKDLANIVETEDVRSLKSVKGIGPKAAQRMLIELKGKFTELAMTGSAVGTDAASNVLVNTALMNEAIQALSVLGFAPAASQKVVRELVKEHSEAPVEQIIKLALKLL